MASLVTTIKSTARTLYQHSLGEERDKLINRTTKVGQDILKIGLFTASCWTLAWLNPRLAPLGFLAGFVRKPIQWIADDFKGSRLTTSRVNVVLLSASMFLSGILTFPIMIPVGIFSASAYAGKHARNILFPKERQRLYRAEVSFSSV